MWDLSKTPLPVREWHPLGWDRLSRLVRGARRVVGERGGPVPWSVPRRCGTGVVSVTPWYGRGPRVWAPRR